MKVDATDAQIAGVRTAIIDSPDVRTFAFVTKADTLAEYHRLKLAGSPTVDQLPTGFLARLRRSTADASFTYQFEALDGVDYVTSRTTRLRDERTASCNPRSDLQVFLVGATTRAQEATVQAALDANPVVQSVHFVSHAEALRSFKCIFRSEPAYLHNITADALPTSFRVVAEPGSDLAALQQQFQGLPNVETVKLTTSRGIVPKA